MIASVVNAQSSETEGSQVFLDLASTFKVTLHFPDQLEFYYTSWVSRAIIA